MDGILKGTLINHVSKVGVPNRTEDWNRQLDVITVSHNAVQEPALCLFYQKTAPVAVTAGKDVGTEMADTQRLPSVPSLGDRGVHTWVQGTALAVMKCLRGLH